MFGGGVEFKEHLFCMSGNRTVCSLSNIFAQTTTLETEKMLFTMLMCKVPNALLHLAACFPSSFLLTAVKGKGCLS